VEVPHTNLSEVTGMVLVNVGSVVVLTTGLYDISSCPICNSDRIVTYHTTTTGMLAVLADTSVTSGDI
jgi:hypothetical protein